MKNFLYDLKLVIRQMFFYPPMQLQDVDYDKYWKEKRGENIGALSDWQTIRADFIVETLKNIEPVLFLDIGCGDGSILNYIKNKGIASKVVGMDTSRFSLDRAEKFGIETVLYDINDKNTLSKIPNTDYSILFEILEHIPESESFLKIVYEKSAKGVFFSFPNTGFYVHRFRLFFGRFPMQWKLSPGEHLRYWTKTDLLWWLDALGYRNFKVKYYKGIPGLNTLWPSMFAAGFVVFLKK